MTDVWFYHLTESTLERALPGLLEKSLERGWKVVVQVGSEERLAALDAHLWSYRDETFLAHGSTRDGTEALQPIWLTRENDNPNHAEIRFLVDGAVAQDLSEYERAVYLFDGHDNDAVTQARERWKVEKDAGHSIAYWQQKPGGGWEKKA